MDAGGWCDAHNVRGEGSGGQIDKLGALGKADGPPGSPMDGDGTIWANAADCLCRLLGVEMTLTKGGSPASNWQQSDVDLRYVLVRKVRTGVAGIPAPVGAGNKITECRSAMRAPRVSSAVMVGG
jgi:hypothetical protein